MAIITTSPTGALNKGNKPSVYDLVELIGHDSAPILTTIKRTQAKAVTHSWFIDDIGDIDIKYYTEISAPEASIAHTKQETTNAIQIFKTTAALSFDQNASSVYGNETEAAHQKKKAMKQHLMKQEGALLGLGRASVYDAPQFRLANTQEGKMAGMPYFLTLSEASFSSQRRGNIFAIDTNGDGTGTAKALNLDLLDEFAAIPYEKNARMTDIFVGVNLKRKINQLFSRQLSNEKDAQTTVQTIELTTGPVRLHLHPYMTDQYGLGNAILGGDFSFAKWAVLEEINRELPTTDSAKQWEYYTSSCIQVTNAHAFAMMIGAK